MINYAGIRKVGEHQYKCLCPFHAEKTPSFSINTKDRIFYCFGCGKEGNLVTLGKLLGYDTKDALDWAVNLQDELAYFTRKLLVSKPKQDPDFVMDESWYAPFKDKILKKFMVERRLTLEILKKFETGHDSRKRYVTWTYRDYDNTFLGAVGRKAYPDIVGPKYYWYWIKHKPVMWGSQFVRREEPIYITEGMIDCMKLHQFGYTNSVASGGKPTHAQLKDMEDFPRIVLAFDNDQSGKDFTKQVGNDLWIKGCKDIKVLFYTGKDIGELTDDSSFRLITFGEWLKSYRRDKQQLFSSSTIDNYLKVC